MDITGFAPTHGPADTEVTLTLTQMPMDATAENTNVFLGGSPVLSIGEVQVNQGGSGTIAVTVGENDQSGEFLVMIGQTTAQSAATFTLDQPEGRPQITSMLPTVATHGQTRVTLRGQNLDQVDYVYVGNVTVMALQHVGNTVVSFLVPITAKVGNQRVVAHSPEYGRTNAASMLTVQ